MTKGETLVSQSSASSVKDVKIDSELQKRALRKLDLHVLPVMTIFFFMSFLDRTNIGNARVAGLESDLNLSEYQYKVCVTILYVPYILSEVPSNLLLKRVGPHLMLPTILSLWGMVTCLQGLVVNFKGLLAARFFLGILEGPMLPAIVLYLSTFYTRQELGIRIATIFTATSLAGAFSGLLAAAISNMAGIGGKPGWAWIFILEGLLTFVIGFSGFFLIPRSPAAAKFLKPDEKEMVLARLEKDRPATLSGGKFHVKEVSRALMSPHVILLIIVCFFNGTTLYGLAIFMPSIVRSMGFSPIRSQLLTVGPFGAGFVVTLFLSYISDKYRSRSIPIACSAILSAIGYAIYLSSDDSYTLYGSLFLTLSGVFSIPPISSAWISNNSEPHYRRATSIGLSAVTTNCGGILSTWMFPLSAAPKYERTIVMNLVFVLLMAAIVVLNGLMLHWRNKQKEDPAYRQRILEPYNEKKTSTEDDSESGYEKEQEANRRAWLDLGDRHPDFKYAT